MAHSERRSSAPREAALALLTGTIFGGVHTVSGHPLDTIKSRMQMDPAFKTASAWTVATSMWRQEGFASFFHGCVPPLWGSMMYRSVMLSAYEFAFTKLDKECEEESFMKSELSPWLPLRPMVVVSSVFASSMRGVLESPIEYAKVMGQIRRQWQWAHVYRGVHWQMLRTTALLIPIFSSMDVCRRKTTLLQSFAGTFFVTAVSSGLAYIMCWPLETFKNLAQSGLPTPGASVAQRIAYLGGPWGVYRGVMPGALAGAMRNGAGMVAMIYAQRLATRLGLRD